MRHVQLLVVWLAPALIVGATAGARAQDRPLAVGAQVRVADTVGVWREGRVARVQPVAGAPRGAATLAWGDTLWLRAGAHGGARGANDSAPVIVGPASHLERVVGREPRPGLAAAVGAALGAALVVGQVASCRGGRGEGPPCRLGYVELPLAAVVGGAVGWLAGQWLPIGRREWAPVATAAPAAR